MRTKLLLTVGGIIFLGRYILLLGETDTLKIQKNRVGLSITHIIFTLKTFAKGGTFTIEISG